MEGESGIGLKNEVSRRIEEHTRKVREVPEESLREIPQASAEVEVAQLETAKLVNTLAERLISVMGAVDPSDDEMPENPYGTELGSRIAGFARTQRGLNDQLSEILRRLEL